MTFSEGLERDDIKIGLGVQGGGNIRIPGDECQSGMADIEVISAPKRRHRAFKPSISKGINKTGVLEVIRGVLLCQQAIPERIPVLAGPFVPVPREEVGVDLGGGVGFLLRLPVVHDARGSRDGGADNGYSVARKSLRLEIR